MKGLLLVLLLGIAGYFFYANHMGGRGNLIPDFTATQRTAARLAPEGTFFVTERHSEATVSGVRAIPAGSRVKAVGPSEGGQTKVRTEDGLELVVPDEILTDDLDVVDRVLATVHKQIRRAQEETDAKTDAAKQELESELQAKRREIDRLGILLSELNTSRERAVKKLQVENAASKEVSISGSATAEEQRARAAVSEIEKKIRKTELAIENLRISIRRQEFSGI